MKIGIYDPYLDTLGGGERYVFSIARSLASDNEVDFFWNEDLTKEAEKKFGFSFGKINFKKNIFSRNTSLLKRLLETRRYDVIFFVSDGSIPFLFSKKNFLIIQYPLPVFNKHFINRLKFVKINGILCYSDFVKKYLDKKLPKKSTVLNPYIDPMFKKLTKENIILNVGRFTKDKNNKKQDFLIEVFKKIIDSGLTGWKFVLCGSALQNDLDFVEELKKKRDKYPIVIEVSPSFIELEEFYAKAKIYWHATGFGENIEQHPERAEHFGISTIEAMSAGAVPVVIDAGGQKEIVENEDNGFLWNTENELVKLTNELIENKDLIEKMSRAATKRAEFFNRERFDRYLREIIK